RLRPYHARINLRRLVCRKNSIDSQFTACGFDNSKIDMLLAYGCKSKCVLTIAQCASNSQGRFVLGCVLIQRCRAKDAKARDLRVSSQRRLSKAQSPLRHFHRLECPRLFLKTEMKRN